MKISKFEGGEGFSPSAPPPSTGHNKTSEKNL